MKQENAEPQPPPPHPNSEKIGILPDRGESPRLENPLSSPKTRNNIKVAGIALLLVLILGMGGAIYFLSKEKARGIEAKLARLESRVQTLESRQSGTATAQSVESLRHDLQKFKEQTAEQFAVSERSVQELKTIRSLFAAPQQATPQITAVEQGVKQMAEPLVPAPQPDKPGKHEPPSENKEAGGFIDFMAAVAKNFVAIAGEVFHKTWDFLSKLLAQPV